MRVAILASGSKGNAALIEHNSTLILLDCGLSLRALKSRTEAMGADLADISALFITHEHADHVKSLTAFVRKFSLIPYMTRGTALKLELAADDFRPLRAYKQENVGELSVLPYPLPHDAREAVQFVFACEGGARLGFATDIGKPLAGISEILRGCNVLVVECNYDPQMLEDNSDYPRAVKNRISSGFGHMSNAQAGELLAQVAHPELNCLIAAHMSENNNDPKIALRELQMQLYRLKIAPQLACATQDEPTGWIEVSC